jgi:hypothetical protein
VTDVNTLINRINQGIAAGLERRKAAADELMLTDRERGLQLQWYDAVAKHAVELLKPCLAAFTG